jgi:uncharacterized protein (TIGR02594 family)
MTLHFRQLSLLAISLIVAASAGSADARLKHRQQASEPPSQIDSADRDMRYPSASGQAAYAAVPRGRTWHHRRAAEAAQSHSNSASAGFTGDALVEDARKYIGTNPTGRASLWCGAFMDMVLKQTGHKGGGNLALGYLHYGRRVAGPQVGAIAVMGRRGGGHVGVVSGIDANGNPIIVSGNHNHTVAESVYPRSRIEAYVLPN